MISRFTSLAFTMTFAFQQWIMLMIKNILRSIFFKAMRNELELCDLLNFYYLEMKSFRRINNKDD